MQYNSNSNGRYLGIAKYTQQIIRSIFYDLKMSENGKKALGYNLDFQNMFDFLFKESFLKKGKQGDTKSDQQMLSTICRQHNVNPFKIVFTPPTLIETLEHLSHRKGFLEHSQNTILHKSRKYKSGNLSDFGLEIMSSGADNIINFLNTIITEEGFDSVVRAPLDGLSNFLKNRTLIPAREIVDLQKWTASDHETFNKALNEIDAKRWKKEQAWKKTKSNRRHRTRAHAEFSLYY